MKKSLISFAVVFCVIGLSYNCLAQDIPINSPAQKLPIGSQQKIYNYVEVMPQFPGREAALVKFIDDNIHYPASATAAGIEGTVFIKFIVDVTGEIKDITITKDIGGGCGEEAVRVVKLMPKWTPGRQNGYMVPVYYNLPIKFILHKG